MWECPWKEEVVSCLPVGSISLVTVLFRGEEHLIMVDPCPFNVYGKSDCLWQLPLVREEGFKENWTVLLFPSLCAWFKARFLSLLCILADRLFQRYALSFRNILYKDCLLYLPTSSRIFNHLKPRRCELVRSCLRRHVGCFTGGLEAEPSHLQWSWTKEC